jgi:glucan phosphorylase
MKEVAKRRKRGFAIGESDETRKEEIRKKEEKREAKEMENRINKVLDLSISLSLTIAGCCKYCSCQSVCLSGV